MNYCAYCSNGEHNLVCNCGHIHALHNFRGSCKVFSCPCSGYSQTAKRTEEETQLIKKEPGSLK